MGLSIFKRIVSSFIKRIKYIQNQPSAKGRQGEKIVSHILQRYCKSEHDYVLNNIILFDATTRRSSQVDHILICSNGIFVIETKNYSGTIYGSDQQREWVQVLAYGNTKNKFHSPVKQNATHIYLVNQILQKKYPVHGFVVFVKNNIEHVQSENVCTPQSLSAYIEAHAQKGGPLNAKEKDEIYALLRLHEESYSVTAKEHLDNIYQLQTDIKSGICPRCGGTLILRKGKYGDFYGCFDYPNCKFTKPVKD